MIKEKFKKVIKREKDITETIVILLLLISFLWLTNFGGLGLIIFETGLLIVVLIFAIIGYFKKRKVYWEKIK